jgi:hypothetical protein
MRTCSTANGGMDVLKERGNGALHDFVLLHSRLMLLPQIFLDGGAIILPFDHNGNQIATKTEGRPGTG